MRYYILQKLWHEYLGIKANDFANDIKQDACHWNLSLRSCYFCWRARGCAFFPNPLSVSPFVRALIFQQNPPANSLFAQLSWYTLFAPSIPRHFFFHKHYPQFLFKSYAKCLGCTRCNMEDVHMECELSLTAFAATNLWTSNQVVGSTPVGTLRLFPVRWCYTRRRFLAQHSVATLLRHCFEWLQHSSNTATLRCAKNRRCKSSRVILMTP